MKMLFETNLSGHWIEYIHHVYIGMMIHSENSFVIVVPEAFREKKKLYDWPKSDNVKFEYIPQITIDEVEISGKIGAAYKRTRLLNKYINQYNPDSILLLSLMVFLPFLPFLVSSRYNIVGIIYKIYFYEWKYYSLFKRVIETLKFRLLSSRNCIKTVFVLNDRAAAAKFNRLYKTQKYEYLVDPYNKLDYIPRNIKESLNISSNNMVILHFGMMDGRKGTLKILEAVKKIPLSKKNCYSFIFAGMIHDSIREDFYKLKDEIGGSAQIIVFDKFCSKEFIADLCHSCDFIIIPYSETSRSSGVIAHAAYERKPLIGPAEGLIGKIIRKHKLGILLNNISGKEIAETLMNIKPFVISSRYAEIANTQRFVNQLFSYF